MRVAIIGAGFIARHAHIPAYLAAGADIVALCDVRRERAEELARQFPVIGRTYDNWQEMLDRERPEVVSICTPNRFHEAPAVAALEMGANVLCEKPIAVDVEEAQRMFAAARRAGKVLMAAQHYRWTPGGQVVKAAVDRGDLGDVYYAEATALRRFFIPYWGEFHYASTSAGGPLLDIGVHMLDLALWLMGNPTPVRVSAKTDRRFGDKPEVAEWVRAQRGSTWNAERYDVEDFAVALIHFATNATLLLRASWATHLDFWQNMSVRLVGEQAGALTNPPGIFRLRDGVPSDESFNNLPPDRAYDMEIAHFLDVAQGKVEPLVKEHETLNVQRILRAAYRSAAEGKEVMVD